MSMCVLLIRVQPVKVLGVLLVVNHKNVERAMERAWKRLKRVRSLCERRVEHVTVDEKRFQDHVLNVPEKANCTEEICYYTNTSW